MSVENTNIFLPKGGDKNPNTYLTSKIGVVLNPQHQSNKQNRCSFKLKVVFVLKRKHLTTKSTPLF